MSWLERDCVENPVEKPEREARYRQRSFDRASRRYDSVSEVQRIMAGRLVEVASEVTEPETILEIGCGTGHLSKHLVRRWPDARLLLTDVSEGMLTRARERLGTSAVGARVRWRVLDARGPGWELEERFRLVASSAVVQWFPDLRAHLAGVAHRSLPGGHYLVAGFLPENLPELGKTLARFGVTLNVGHSRAALEAASRAAELRIQRFQTEAIVREYAGARELLDALRTMGASRYPGERPLARRALRELMKDYERHFASPGGVRATWQVWYAVLAR